MLTYIFIALAIIVGVAMAISAIKSGETGMEHEGIKRAGRIGLWIAFPPLGLYRSARHGRRKHEDRLAKKIGEELRK